MKQPKFIEWVYGPLIFPVIFSCILTLEILRIFFPISILYLISRISLAYFILAAVITSKNNYKFRLYTFFLILFAIWALMTTFWSKEPLTTLPRSMYFVFIAVTASAAGYLCHKHFPRLFLSFLLPTNIIIVSLSMFSLLTNWPSDAWFASWGTSFKGFAPHQNVLGMMIIFTVPFYALPLKVLFEASLWRQKGSFFDNRSIIIFFICFAILALFNFYILFITQSRASIISLIVMMASFLILIRSWKFFVGSLAIFITVMLVLFLTTPMVKNFAMKYILKTETSIGDRRSTQIKATFSAAKNGGYYGLGFGVSDPDNVVPNDSESNRYYREKMISVLALVEEVGIIGLFIFLFIIGNCLIGLFKILNHWRTHTNIIIRDSSEYMGTGIQSLKYLNTLAEKYNYGKTAFLISIILGLSFNAQFEGWWLGPGSWQFLLFFIFLGYAVSFYSDFSPHHCITEN